MDRTPVLDLVTDLTPVAERLLERHLAARQGVVPARVRAVVPRPGLRRPATSGTPTRSPIDPAVRSALFVNLLTEDNLPYYFAHDRADASGPTARGARGSGAGPPRRVATRSCIRDYLTVTRAIDPVALERARMAQVECGEVPEPATAAGQLRLRRAAGARDPHRAPQHRQAARRPGRLRGDEAGRERREPPLPLLPRPRAPPRSRSTPRRWCARSSARCARSRCRAPASSTSTSTPRRSPRAGIYDFSVHHEQILVPVVLRHWNIEALEGLDARGRRSPRPRSLRASIGSARPVAGWRPGAPRTTRSRSPASARRFGTLRRSGCYALRRRLLWPPPLRALPLLRRGPRLCGPRRPPGRPERSAVGPRRGCRQHGPGHVDRILRRVHQFTVDAGRTLQPPRVAAPDGWPRATRRGRSHRRAAVRPERCR